MSEHVFAASPKMRVTLIDHTGKYAEDPARVAASMLVFSKRTRIEMRPGGFEDIVDNEGWDEIERDLAYASATVPSSWEFVDYTFLIENVTRAFTHQLVRTRTMSYAQQAMQVLDMSQGPGWDYLIGPTLAAVPEARDEYVDLMGRIARFYSRWVKDERIKTEDVRGALPTNILTNILLKGNLRAFCDLIRKRVSPRNQGEFPEVLRFLKREMTHVHQWTTMFLEREADKVAAELYAMLPLYVENKVARTDMTKRIDQLLTNVGGGS